MRQYKILSINLDEVIESGDTVGIITLQDLTTNEIHENAIWYSDDNEHYFCYETDELNEDDEPVLEDILISDVKVGDIIE